MILKVIISLFLTSLSTTKHQVMANMNDYSKYQFGGADNQDLYSSDFFNQIASYLTRPETAPQYEVEPEETEAEEDDFNIEDNEEYTSLLDSYNTLSQEYETLKTQQSAFQDSGDSFLSFLFDSDSTLPVRFTEEELSPTKRVSKGSTGSLYEEAAPYQGMKYGFGASGEKERIDCSGYVCKVLDVPRTTSEGLLTGSSNFRKLSDSDSLKEGTVVGFDMGSKSYDKGRKHGIDHVAIVIKNPKTGQLELSESTSGKGVISRPLDSALQSYQKRAKSIFVGEYQYGGAVANTSEELYNGLNNSPLDSLTLNLPKMYNMIRGLDSGEPVKVQDEIGNEQILNGPYDVQKMFGKVYEQKL